MRDKPRWVLNTWDSQASGLELKRLLKARKEAQSFFCQAVKIHRNLNNCAKDHQKKAQPSAGFSELAGSVNWNHLSEMTGISFLC